MSEQSEVKVNNALFYYVLHNKDLMDKRVLNEIDYLSDRIYFLEMKMHEKYLKYLKELEGKW